MDSLRDFTKYLPSKVLVKVVTRKSFARFHVHTTDESTPSRTHVMRPLRVEERVGNELGVDVLRVESVGHDLEDDGLGVVQDILDLVERRGVRGDEAVVERPRLLQVLMAVRDGDGTVLGGELAARDLGTDDGAVDARAVVQLVALGGREQGNPFLVRHLEAEGVEADAAALLPVVGVPRIWVGAAEEVEVVRPVNKTRRQSNCRVCGNKNKLTTASSRCRPIRRPFPPARKGWRPCRCRRRTSGSPRARPWRRGRRSRWEPA